MSQHTASVGNITIIIFYGHDFWSFRWLQWLNGMGEIVIWYDLIIRWWNNLKRMTSWDLIDLQNNV